jgi:23S rRNA (cytidine1920-2'-O)/16S rRNA (cytidine1409-2'-O)-methyltransferase
MRLDLYLVKNNLCETRNKAKACILAKQIKINDKIVDKPNYEVKENDQVAKLAVDEYVSRGAYKLLKAIDT